MAALRVVLYVILLTLLAVRQRLSVSRDPRR
jgi:hypothetical protein